METWCDSKFLWVIVKIDTDFSGAFDVKVTNPFSPVRQKNFDIVMSWLKFDHPNSG